MRIVISLLLAVVTACSVNAVKDNPENTPQLKLYVLRCGYFYLDGWGELETNYGIAESELAIAAMADPCFLVVHGTQTLLWDTGLPDSTPAEPWKDSYGLKVQRVARLRDQLQALGYAPEDISYLALSHLHVDHIGNLEYFRDNRILLQRREWQYALSEAAVEEPAYKLGNYHWLADAPQLTLLDGPLDVFGDGTVMLLPAPGHTPGSQILKIKLPKYGEVILSGDVVHFREELERDEVAPSSVSATEARTTQDWIRGYCREHGAELWVQHDPVQYRDYRFAPEYYQ